MINLKIIEQLRIINWPDIQRVLLIIFMIFSIISLIINLKEKGFTLRILALGIITLAILVELIYSNIYSFYVICIGFLLFITSLFIKKKI